MSYKGSGLLLVVFHFGSSHSLKIISIRKGRRCHVHAAHETKAMHVRASHVCAHVCVDGEMGTLLPTSAPALVFLSMQLGT